MVHVNRVDQFPVHSQSLREHPLLRAFVPWAFVNRFAREAATYHSQTLERLAERGGLSWSEIAHLIHLQGGGASTTFQWPGEVEGFRIVAAHMADLAGRGR